MTDHSRPNWMPGQAKDAPQEKPISENEFRTLPSRNPHQAFIVGDFLRPGFSSFVVEVEYSMYTPDTPENAKFELVVTEFPLGSKMLWFTFVIPIEDLEKVKELAKKYNFELKQDTLPVAIDGKGSTKFPMDYGSNVFNITGIHPDKMLLQKYKEYWLDVIDKHAQGIPWKV